MLKFGSGRSTIWLANRLKKFTSVEHNKEWFKKVSDMFAKTSGMSEKGLNYLLYEDGIGNKESCDYVEVVKSMPDLSLDFVLVDGACRDYCAYASISKIRSGGILVIDNINWYIPKPSFVESTSPASLKHDDDFETETWSKVWEQICDWRFIWTSNGVTDNALFQKPDEVTKSV